jgi:DNA primase
MPSACIRKTVVDFGCAPPEASNRTVLPVLPTLRPTAAAEVSAMAAASLICAMVVMDMAAPRGREPATPKTASRTRLHQRRFVRQVARLVVVVRDQSTQGCGACERTIPMDHGASGVKSEWSIRVHPPDHGGGIVGGGVPNEPSVFRHALAGYPFGVARVQQGEIDRIQHEVSLERLVRGRGVALRGHGGGLTGVCPFHSRSRPKLVLDRKANTWSCRSCKVTAGTVVDWTMRAEGVSRRHAIELLRADQAVAGSGGKVVKRSSTKRLPVAFDHAADDAKLLGQVVGYYHGRLKANAAAIGFLQKRGITGEAIDRFHIGFSDRTIGYAVPDKNRVAGAELRGRLRALGILRPTGHETLRGCVTIPFFDTDGAIVSLYGRRIDPVGVADLYVGKGGLWNREAFTAAKEVVVCACPFEGLILWSAGVKNAVAIHGLDGPLDELLGVVEAHGTTKVTLAFPRTAEGDHATKTLADMLIGVEILRALPPEGMDVAECVASSSPERLVGIIRSAEWIGGVRPAPDPALPRIVGEGSSESVASTAPTKTRGDEIVFEQGDRLWRVRGLSANTSYERLRVHVFVSRETRDARTSGYFVDTLDLYSARQRSSFVTQAADELGLSADVVKRDLGHILLRLEALQDENIKATLKPTDVTPTMTEVEREAALGLLREGRRRRASQRARRRGRRRTRVTAHGHADILPFR